jgi:hypothetical protein
MKFNEQVIKEKRTIEATKKEFLGPNSKLVVICRNLGDEIISQEDNYNQIKYDDFWENKKSNGYETLDENTPIHSLGYYFYGLSYSYDIELYFLENEKTVKVNFEGKRVYQETNGELESYAPGEKWENIIENLYKLALKKENIQKNKEKEIQKQIFDIKKNSILKTLRDTWGV